MVKMSTMEFISSQNLILSSAAKNYGRETEYSNSLIFKNFKVSISDGIIQPPFIHALRF